MPGAETHVQAARDTVTEPREEQDAAAQADVVDALDERPAPSPEIEAACDRIREVIRARRPPDEDALVEARPREMASAAGQAMNQGIEQRVDSVGGQYDDLDRAPAGQPGRPPVAMELPPGNVTTPDLRAETGVPDALEPGQVSLDDDVAEQRERLEEAGMTTEPAQQVEDGPIAEARDGVSELEEVGATGPGEALAAQDEAIARAATEMRALQEASAAALARARASSVKDLGGLAVDSRASEETRRQQAGAAMQGIYRTAREQVNAALAPLSETALQRWDAGVEKLAAAFEQSLAHVAAKIEERHSGIIGGLAELKDDVFGLPDWATDAYDAAETAFSDGCCEQIRDISRDVNQVIEDCEQIIARARAAIDELARSLPEDLRAWATGEATRYGQELDALQSQVTSTRQGLNRDLVDRSNAAVQEVRERIHELREAAKGVIGRIADAVREFVKDPARAIINGLLRVVGISPPRFWSLVDTLGDVIGGIADDPRGFANNLLKGVGQGFEQFVENFPAHISEGLFGWMFSRLGEVGVMMPPDFSIPSIVSLVLDVLGITWDRVRELLARHIGEDKVAQIDKAYGIIVTFIAQGPLGLVELLREQLDPASIVAMIRETAIRYLLESVVETAVKRIALMLNPVGAIAQAVERIYRVLSWIYQNAARIFTLIEAVVNGAARVLAGDVSGLASMVEYALVGLIVPVIDFLADFLGLGGIPDAIRDLIKGLQDRVEEILDGVIEFLADKAKGLMKAVGLGGEEGGSAESQLEEHFRDTDGQSHELTVSMVSDRPDIRVASSKPTGVQHQIADRRKAAQDGSDPLSDAQNDALTRAWDDHDKLFALARRYMNADMQQKQALKQEMTAVMGSLSTNMIEGDAWPDEEIEPTQVTFSGSGGQKKVVASPLTRSPGNTVGSAAADVLSGWRQNIPDQGTGRGSTQPWRRVHLLADRLHGPGDNSANLIPGGEVTNGALRRGPEQLAYERIKRGETLEYVAQVTGLDPDKPFFPQSPNGVRVTVTRIAPGEREVLDDRSIPTMPAPSASREPQLSPREKLVVNAYRELKKSLGRKPTQTEAAAYVAREQNYPSLSQAHISQVLAGIRKLIEASPRPLTAEFAETAEILDLRV